MRLGPFQEERDEENIVNAILKEIVRHFCCGQSRMSALAAAFLRTSAVIDSRRMSDMVCENVQTTV